MDGELRAEGLRKRYGPKEVVRGVDLLLKRGEIVALFGPNGAGKTTPSTWWWALSGPPRGASS